MKTALLFTFILTGSITALACTDYSGTYQVEDETDQIIQTDCSKIEWKTLPGGTFPAADNIYILNNQPQNIGGDSMTPSIDQNGNFAVAQTAGSNTYVLVYTLSTTPCPRDTADGSTYLVQQMYFNGQDTAVACTNWKKVN